MASENNIVHYYMSYMYPTTLITKVCEQIFSKNKESP